MDKVSYVYVVSSAKRENVSPFSLIHSSMNVGIVILSSFISQEYE